MKDQIIRFNELLEKQVELMRQVGITSVSLSNGSLHLSKFFFILHYRQRVRSF